MGDVADYMMDHFDEQFLNVFKEKENPTEEKYRYWLFATPDVKKINKDFKKMFQVISDNRRHGKDRVGKWFVFEHIDNIDEAWKKIKTATENCELGFSAKVATAKPSPRAKDPNQKVICVYTYDFTDKKDVYRVREKLAELGWDGALYYKTDEMTRSGKNGSYCEG
jgi:hypothetical protein